jgi:hypothetical protein
MRKVPSDNSDESTCGAQKSAQESFLDYGKCCSIKTSLVIGVVLLEEDIIPISIDVFGKAHLVPIPCPENDITRTYPLRNEMYRI